MSQKNRVIHIEGTDRTGKDTFRSHLVKEGKGSTLIIVRSFISQVVYSRIYGRTIDEQWFVNQALELQKLGHIFVYLKVNLDIVKQRIIDTNEEDVNIYQIEHHTQIFNEVVDFFKSNGLKVIILDNTHQDLNLATRLLELAIIKQGIQDCTSCSKYQMPVNQFDLSKGRGKLIPDVQNSNPYYLIVGMNPSSLRYPQNQFPFEVNDKGKNQKFREILSELGILQQSVITNLVKCTLSGEDNYEFYAHKCLSHIQKEIELLKPTKIIALGNKTYKALIKNKIFNPENIIEIWHPAYCYSHHKTTHDEYKQHIKERI